MLEKLAALFVLCALSRVFVYCSEKRFPDDFLLGTSTAAYQIEGGWDADGRLLVKCLLYADDQVILAPSVFELQEMVTMMNEGFKQKGMKVNVAKTKVMVIEKDEEMTECVININGKGVSIWDHYLHERPDLVKDLTNGDVTADSYHLYKRDVKLLKAMGAKAYRFSVSWTRVLPNGTADYVNPFGIAYYNNLINELIANDIVPFITIYHWDLPIGISNQGGWLNEETVPLYMNYARVVFAAFGDRVKNWITMNEPYVHCSNSYGYGVHPPLIKSPGTGFYDCGRNMLLAHAEAYWLYTEEFKAVQLGRVGITLDHQWAMAATFSEDDAEAVEDYNAFHLGQYLHPILKGDYPERLSNRIAEKSASQGFSSSRLRPFTQKQKELIYGTADFIGINHYMSLYVYRNKSVTGMFNLPSFDDDAGVGQFSDPSWPVSALPVMTEYAPGFYDILLYIKDNYDNPTVYVTETGFPLTIAEDLEDDMKVHYLNHYLDALLDAKAAGSNCQGYFFWSLLDTFEWASGYTLRFGLHQVDMDDPARPRRPRKSALVYTEIIRTGTINFSYNPNPYKQTQLVLSQSY